MECSFYTRGRITLVTRSAYFKGTLVLELIVHWEFKEIQLYVCPIINSKVSNKLLLTEGWRSFCESIVHIGEDPKVEGDRKKPKGGKSSVRTEV